MSLHAVTASITLLTAIPGSGKTLRMVQMMAAHLAQGDLVYAANVDGLRLPGVIPWDDPTDWENLPAGAVLFVDEAQKFFRARRSGEPPNYLQAMEEIRHSGIRLVIATQQPNYLDTHLRGLVGRHEHMVRYDGEDKATIYRSNSVLDNVRQLPTKQGIDKFVWPFPEEHYNDYDSAEVHTVKKQMPARMKAVYALFGLVGVAVVGAVLLLVFAFTSDDANAEGTRGAALAGPSFPLMRNNSDDPLLTAEQYVARLQPRVDAMPWSAPVFDGQEATARPTVACMYSGEGEGADGRHLDVSCTCFTEQATRYEVDHATCAHLARNGPPYNPFAEPPRESSQNSDIVGPSSPMPATASISSGQVNGYGDLGVGLNPGPAAVALVE